jgi:sulfide:quinone oxidoreductase
VVPREATWSLAAYELALLTAAERDARRLQGVELSLVTHETAPLGIFGDASSELVAERLRESGVSLHTSTTVERFDSRGLTLSGGGALEVDRAVALPAVEVPPLPGLPQRGRGFVITDADMQVFGLDRVWAAGDVTSFPIKQGGLAAQQADVAARGIAVRAGARVDGTPFQPVLRAALITGGVPEFLRTRLGVAEGESSIGRALWWPPVKLAGDYLAPYLAKGAEPLDTRLLDFDAPADPREDEEEYTAAVRLLLAAAEADAAGEDYAAALGWLAMVEQLELALPAAYVARRESWRRALDPRAELMPAAGRIDPSFVDAASALSDLERRLGWMRQRERAGAGEMREGLDQLDRGLDQLMLRSRRTGAYGRSEDG